ncbi:hypothetical protein T4D_3339 [Trichinella pseudospiralis]|uniref:Uncharacterized protein n=1 Tax=Trichinella pseudospiralis TaxID=6337 RepID=A0A0V1F2H8_TRIPS|nr:hypothetical protein T4D_3339 [Trichinella pseudospiralis]
MATGCTKKRLVLEWKCKQTRDTKTHKKAKTKCSCGVGMAARQTKRLYFTERKWHQACQYHVLSIVGSSQPSVDKSCV